MRISRNKPPRRDSFEHVPRKKKTKKLRPQNKIPLTLSELLRPAVKRLFDKKERDNLQDNHLLTVCTVCLFI